jgi:hypothetical protein
VAQVTVHPQHQEDGQVEDDACGGYYGHHCARAGRGEGAGVSGSLLGCRGAGLTRGGLLPAGRPGAAGAGAGRRGGALLPSTGTGLRILWTASKTSMPVTSQISMMLTSAPMISTCSGAGRGPSGGREGGHRGGSQRGAAHRRAAGGAERCWGGRCSAQGPRRGRGPGPTHPPCGSRRSRRGGCAWPPPRLRRWRPRSRRCPRACAPRRT